MIDFIKNNKAIAVGGFVLLVLVLAFIVLLFIPRGSHTDTENTDTNNPFGEVDAERTDNITNQDAYDNPGEQFIAEEGQDGTVPTLRAITSMPVVGAVSFIRNTDGNKVSHVRYTNHTNGHVYETTLATINPEKKIANTTKARVGEVEWAKNGSATVLRYYGTDLIVTHTTLGQFVRGTTTENPLIKRAEDEIYQERTLPGNIVDIVFSPDGTQMFYLVKTLQGVIGYVESVETGTSAQIWSSMLRSVSIEWSNKNAILIYTNPSSVAEGAVWSLNPNTGEETVMLTGRFALEPLLSPDGTKLLYSTQEEGNKLFSLDILDTTSGSVISLPLVTMASKCAWGPYGSKYLYCAIPNDKHAGGYLEDWYMGLVSSEDTLWRIDTEAGVVKKLIDPLEETEQTFDIIDLSVSPDENFLLFRTRNNSVLWSLMLPEKIVVKNEEEVEPGDE